MNHTNANVIENICIVCDHINDNYCEHEDLNGDGDVDGDGDDDEDNSTDHFSYVIGLDFGSFFRCLVQFEYLVVIAMALVMVIVQNFNGDDDG